MDETKVAAEAEPGAELPELLRVMGEALTTIHQGQVTADQERAEIAAALRTLDVAFGALARMVRAHDEMLRPRQTASKDLN